MKVGVIVGFLVVAVIASVAYAEKCHGHDTSTCHVQCNNDGEMTVCSHDVCTCEAAGVTQAPTNCLSGTDCSTFSCKNDETVHCVDNICKCMKGH